LAWTDDLTFAIMAKATDLTKKVTFLLSIITDTMAEHAMKLSYGQGKTTVVLAYRGWKAVRERQKMEKQMGNKIALPTEHYGCLEVPVVPYYKHLGGYILRSGAKLLEIRVRQALAMQN